MVLYGFIWEISTRMDVLYGNIWENHGNIWGYPAWLCQTKSELENGPLIVGLTVQDGDFL